MTRSAALQTATSHGQRLLTPCPATTSTASPTSYSSMPSARMRALAPGTMCGRSAWVAMCVAEPRALLSLTRRAIHQNFATFSTCRTPARAEARARLSHGRWIARVLMLSPLRWMCTSALNRASDLQSSLKSWRRSSRTNTGWTTAETYSASLTDRSSRGTMSSR